MNKNDILVLNKISYAIACSKTESSVLDFFSERSRFKSNLKYIDGLVCGILGAGAVSGGVAVASSAAVGFAKLTTFLKGAAFGANAWCAVIGLAVGIIYLGGRLAFTEKIFKLLSGKDIAELNAAIDQVRATAGDLEHMTQCVLTNNSGQIDDSSRKALLAVARNLHEGLVKVEALGFDSFIEHRVRVEDVLNRN